MACGCSTAPSPDGKAAATGCETGGCNKMNVYDWLGDMDIPLEQRFNIVEIRFKGGRKEFFRNVPHLELYTGDAVIVEVAGGHHLGHVSLQNDLVRLQMKKKGVVDNAEIKQIYRVANAKDLEKYEQTKAREMPVMFRSREIIRESGLQMKLSDVEFQADNTKATFFYSADDRVNFRELIKMLASEFKVRVDMRQISLRQEAGRLGGLGSCGRELCCSTWITEFKAVSTVAARYQNLSLNPTKLSGQCGRLKCCLNYELETYMDALKGIPAMDAPLKTKRGLAYLQKTDIFKKILWFGYRDENVWHPLPVARVNEIIALNRSGSVPESLLEDELAIVEAVPLNNDLAKLDKKLSDKERKFKQKRKKK